MASPNGDRVAQFRRNVVALNKQFSEWCNTQVAEAPHRLLASGVSDYLRHAAKLRLEFDDIIADDQPGDASVPAGPTDAATARRALPYVAPRISLIPACHAKTIYFIRHGEGFHNIGLANRDAHLTPKGWVQAHALGKHMRAHDLTVQLVIVSPLTRALETAAGVFGEIGGEGVLMRAQAELPEVRAGHAEIGARPGLRVVANELARERLGPSSCDSRRPRREIAVDFPGVDFSAVVADADADWRPGQIESEESVVLRGRRFLAWLATLPETQIAVVTHSAFLWFTLSGFSTDAARPVRERLQRWYQNCEMRAVVLSDGGAVVAAGPDLDFAGGAPGVGVLEPQQELMNENGNDTKEKKDGPRVGRIFSLFSSSK